MIRLALILSFLVNVSLVSEVFAAGQTVEPSVMRALNTAQVAQQKGDYAAAERALDGVKGEAGSLEETLLWRSHGYLAWAQGRNGKAIEFLNKVVKSGKLDDASQANEKLNLAKLNLTQQRYKEVIRLLTPVPAKASEEVLQMLVQSYQASGQPAKALPLAERYVQAHPRAEDRWLQFLVGVNADLKRYSQAEKWQQQLLARSPNDVQHWRQLAALQQLSGSYENALATLRTARTKGLNFSAKELDNLTLLASAADQPWQGAKLLKGMLDQGLLANNSTRQERLGLFYWQARDRAHAVEVYRQLASASGSGKHWMNVAQLELEQSRWKAGLTALKKAESAGADRRQVREWRNWAENELNAGANDRLASTH